MNVEQWILWFFGNEAGAILTQYLTYIILIVQATVTFAIKNKLIIKAALLASKDQQVKDMESKINTLCEISLVLAEQNSILTMNSKLAPEAKQKVVEKTERMRVLAKTVHLDMAKDVVETVRAFDIDKEKAKVKQVIEQVTQKQDAVIQTNTALEEAVKRMNTL